MIITCKKCGAEFEAHQASQKYCSDECRKKVRYDADRAWLARNREHSAEYMRNWQSKNREATNASSKKYYLKKLIERLENEKLS